MTQANLSKTINYGPLTQLIGCWQGSKGLDISPEEDGEERNLYREEIIFEPIGDLSNAEQQELVCLRYQQTVIRLSDNKMIHNESGYYSWDESNQQIIKSFSIPRGVAVVAGGTVSKQNEADCIEVNASINNVEWSIVQSPFMQEKALTQDYHFAMQFSDKQMNYSQTMQLEIFGKSFTHRDENQLVKVDADN